jgi:hypothetical protein
MLRDAYCYIGINWNYILLCNRLLRCVILVTANNYKPIWTLKFIVFFCPSYGPVEWGILSSRGSCARARISKLWCLYHGKMNISVPYCSIRHGSLVFSSVERQEWNLQIKTSDHICSVDCMQSVVCCITFVGRPECEGSSVGIVTGYGLGDRGSGKFDSWRGQEIFIFSTASRLALGPS